MGLRIAEVAALGLDDIDWRRGEITVRGKGNRRERLPLPADVGEPIVAYLTGSGPATADGTRTVFIETRAQHRAADPGRGHAGGGPRVTPSRAGHRAGLSSVSNLAANPPRDAVSSMTSPRSVNADELGRCGAEHGC